MGNKKMIFIIGSIFMILSLFTPKITAEAGTLLTLQQLQQKFPHGKYWNHAGSSKNNPDGYTNTGCSHHGNCSKGGTDYSGSCGCNSFGSSIQCFGFANKCAYDLYGSYYTSWSRGSLNTVKPGDVIRYKNNGHSILVTSVSGNIITYGDCNSDNHCKIMWNKTINKATVQSTLTAVYSAPWQLSSVSSSHTHSYTKYVFYEAIHPHYKCYQCTICGAVERRTTEPVYLKDCTYCKNHTHSYTQKTFYEAIHPHYQCYKCVYCDAVERRITEPVYLENCTYCKNHTHSYTQKTFYEKCHPHYQCYQCTICGAVERKLSEPLYFDDCGYCNYSKFGDGFYAYIVQKDTGVPVINNNGNVEVGSTVGDKNSIWKFLKQTDGSYAIYSCVDGKAMNVENANSGQSFLNINTTVYDGTKKQLWSIIWKADNSFSIKSKCDTGTILNIKDNKSAKGTNICTAPYDNSNAQTFSIVRLSDLLQVNAPTVSVRAGSSLVATSISWTAVNNAEAYDLTITDATGKVVRERKNLSCTGVLQKLPEGTYQAKISAKNTRYEILFAESEAKSFTVAKESEEWSGSIVFNNNTYELYDYSLNWEEANTFCEKMGGHLVTITSEEEQKAINRLIKEGKYVRYWQGLTDKEVEGDFVYVTGETTTYSNWCAGEPNNKGNEDYAAIMKPSGEWADYAVTGVNMSTGRTGFILEREYVPVTILPEESDSIILNENDKFQVKLKVYPENALVPSVSFDIEDTQVAQVNENGEIIALNAGNTVLKVYTNDGRYTWQKKIIVNHGQTEKHMSLQDADIEVVDKVVYTGHESKPKITVKVNEQQLAEGKDFVLSYQNNVMAGKGQVVVKGMGNYTGTAQKEFVIEKATLEYRGNTEFVVEQGETLGSIDLPSGLYIEQPEQIMDRTGSFTCQASYNPDFKNYETQMVLLLIHVQENTQEQFLEEGDELSYEDGIYEVVEADEDGSTIQLLEWEQSDEANIILPDSIVYNGVVYYVVEIGEKAFKNNKKLTSITIGSHVTEIGRQAFSGCKELVTIKGGDSVETIGAEAFSNCRKLTSTIHLKKLKSLGNRCFKGCKQITKVYLGKTVKRIGKEAFCNCNQLKQITVATTKLDSKSVGKNAFAKCSSEMTVRFPSKRYKKYKKIFIKRGISDDSKFLK